MGCTSSCSGTKKTQQPVSKNDSASVPALKNLPVSRGEHTSPKSAKDKEGFKMMKPPSHRRSNMSDRSHHGKTKEKQPG